LQSLKFNVNKICLH